MTAETLRTLATRTRHSRRILWFVLASALLARQGVAQDVQRIDEIIRYFSDEWDAVTIHHLLSHTSGIPSFTSFSDYELTKTLTSRPDKTLARFRDKPLEFQPGERFSYNNSGYILLALLAWSAWRSNPTRRSSSRISLVRSA